MDKQYIDWLSGHLDAAKVRYEELCELDDKEQAINGESAYYEQAHQMFGYIAGLEKCLREAKASGKPKTAAKR